MRIPTARSFLRNLFARRAADARLDHELEAYVEMLAAEHRAAGLPPDVALRQARIDAGGLEQVKEEVREARSGAGLDSFAKDLKQALRSLRRSPVFAATAMITLALGTGATLVVLAITDAVLLRPLPYIHPEQLVTVLQHGTDPVTPGDYFDWKSAARAFGGVEAAEYWTPAIGLERPDKVTALHVTPGMMRLLGATPMLGSGFTQGTDGAPEVILGNAIWKSRFGGDESIIGRSIMLDARPYTVVGVMKPDFRFAPFWATDAQLWAPLAMAGKSADHGGSSLRLFARLAPGVSIAQAQRELDGITARLAGKFRDNNLDVRVVSLKDKAIGDTRRPLAALLAAVAIVLLMTWVNVGHMLLARAHAREHELSVRIALGASRFRVMRAALAEAALLTAIGGVAAAGLAQVALGLIAARGPFSLPQLRTLGIDARLGIVGFVLLGITAVVISILPALLAGRASHGVGMQLTARSSTDSASRARLRSILLASEMAFALVLLVATSLMVRTFVAIRAIDPGFVSRGVITMQVPVPRGADSPASRIAWFNSVQARVRALPGVGDAGFMNHLPVIGDQWGIRPFGGVLENARSSDVPRSVFRVATPGLFSAMGIRLEAGRAIDEHDDLSHDGVVVINRRLAGVLWPGANAIGSRISFTAPGGDRHWSTVVGIVADVKQQRWTAPSEPEVYFPYAQSRMYLEGNRGVNYLTLVARTSGDGSGVANAVRQMMHEADPTAPVTEIRTLASVVDEVTAPARFLMDVLIGFGGLAVILTAIGFYGVMSYAVTRREREIGIRMALGESASTTARSFLLQTGRVSAAGIGAGLVMAAALVRFIAGQLYGVAPTDPWSFGVAAGGLAVVAILATAGPVLTALRTDPLTAIRGD